MSAPTYVGQTDTPLSSVSGGNVAWPPAHQAGDLGLLIVETANQAIAAPSGWTEAANSPQGTGTAGAAGAVRLHAFTKYAASAAEADVAIPDSGDHQRARIYAFRGTDATTPFNLVGGSVVATPDTAVSIPGGTTTRAECLVFAIVGNATDLSNNQTTIGSWVNADLTGFTRQTTGNTTVGVGGGWDGGMGTKDTAGAFGATTSTLGTASAQALLLFAIQPPDTAPPPAVTDGGIFIATGVKATAGLVSSTTGAFDTGAVQARVSIFLKPPTAPPVNLAPVIAAIPAITGAVGQALVFPVTVTDPEGNALTVTLAAATTSVPSGAAIAEDEGSGLYIFTWTPDSTQVGEWEFYVSATDGTGTTLSRVSIVVQASPETSMREIAIALADRANTDLESLRALADLLDEREQLNANVVRLVRGLVSDAEESRDYIQGVLAELEEEPEEQ